MLVWGTVLVDDSAWLEDPSVEDPAQPLQPAAEIDCVCSVGILISTVFVVYRGNHDLGGELVGIRDLRSIAS